MCLKTLYHVFHLSDIMVYPADKLSHRADIVYPVKFKCLIRCLYVFMVNGLLYLKIRQQKVDFKKENIDDIFAFRRKGNKKPKQIFS